MANGFQPRFADLVRNYTTTSGTDDFVLSAAVNGFSSFTDALQVGDRFYYSALGIDNPADTEVGRGLLLDGGIVSREPICGTKTNFKSGTKAIALIMASEWFARVDATTNSVRSFGARGDSDASAATGTDDTAAFQAAIDAIGAAGGGVLRVPDGYYKIDQSCLTLCQKVKIEMSPGAYLVTSRAGGGGASLDGDVAAGSMFFSNWPSNASTAANIIIEGGNIVCTNAGNTGAAFYDNGGTYIKIRDVNVTGFKYGVIFDQSEIADVEGCNIHPADAGGACVWLVNKGILKTGNIQEFTNRVGVHRCQLNAGSSVDLIRDDGGDTHVFSHNNYNGGKDQLRLAGAAGFTIHGGEFEAASGNPVSLHLTASDGTTGVGPAFGSMYGGYVIGSVHGNWGGSSCSFFGTHFLGGQVPVVGSQDGMWKFYGSSTSHASAQWVDNTRCQLVVDQMIALREVASSNWTINNDHLNSLSLISNGVPTSVTIPNDATYAFPWPTGTFVEIEQYWASGSASFVAGAGVTLTGPLQAGPLQRLRAVKMSANYWEVQLIVPRPLDAASDLADIADAASARGNLDVYSKEEVDAAVAAGGGGGGALQAPQSWADKIALAKQMGTGVVLDESAVQVSHTGDTNTFVFATIMLPGGSMGANGQVIIDAQFSCTSNANTKSFNIQWGTVGLGNSAVTATSGIQIRHRVANRNLTNSQLSSAMNFGNGGWSTPAQETANDLTIAIQGTLANAADTIRLESFLVVVYPKD